MESSPIRDRRSTTDSGLHANMDGVLILRRLLIAVLTAPDVERQTFSFKPRHIGLRYRLPSHGRRHSCTTFYEWTAQAAPLCRIGYVLPYDCGIQWMPFTHAYSKWWCLNANVYLTSGWEVYTLVSTTDINDIFIATRVRMVVLSTVRAYEVCR